MEHARNNDSQYRDHPISRRSYVIIVLVGVYGFCCGDTKTPAPYLVTSVDNKDSGVTVYNSKDRPIIEGRFNSGISRKDSGESETDGSDERPSVDASDDDIFLEPIELTELGSVIEKHTTYGNYIQYLPGRTTEPSRIIVVAHEQISEDETALVEARRTIGRWIEIAEEQEQIVIVPAFDQQNYGGFEGPGGGYRGLFGRIIGADEFVNLIVDRYISEFPSVEENIILFGHGSGGQFANRYLVLHPDRIYKAAISASSYYAFPDANVTWADGMQRLIRELCWQDPSFCRSVDIRPDPEGWISAATLPITVLVGSEDNSPLTPTPGQQGDNVLENAQIWVTQMNAYAAENGKNGTVELVVVDGVNRSEDALTAVAIEHLYD